jgi:hypothetical protein
MQRPIANENQKPSANENQKPSANLSERPSANENQKPSVNQPSILECANALATACAPLERLNATTTVTDEKSSPGVGSQLALGVWLVIAAERFVEGVSASGPVSARERLAAQVNDEGNDELSDEVSVSPNENLAEWVRLVVEMHANDVAPVRMNLSAPKGPAAKKENTHERFAEQSVNGVVGAHGGLTRTQEARWRQSPA